MPERMARGWRTKPRYAGFHFMEHPMLGFWTVDASRPLITASSAARISRPEIGTPFRGVLSSRRP